MKLYVLSYRAGHLYNSSHARNSEKQSVNGIFLAFEEFVNYFKIIVNTYFKIKFLF